MNNIKHIVWDWNGTLVNDGWLFVELINRVLKKRGLKEINLDIYQKTFCFPLEKYYQKLGFNFNIESYEIPSMEFITLYNKNKYRPLLYVGARELLKKIIAFGVKNYLLSAQNEISLLELVHFYKLEDRFEMIRGTNNLHARGKGVVARNLLKNIRSDNSVLFIGDTSLDMDIAKKFGGQSVGVTFGHQAKERFEKSGNIKLIDNFKDLDSWLLTRLRGSR